MFYKSIILDFLVKINNLSIVKEYINKLYGENCGNIIKEESKAEAKTETPPITAAAVPSIGSDGKKPSFKIIKAQTAISTAENSTENRRPKNSFLKFSIEKAP